MTFFTKKAEALAEPPYQVTIIDQYDLKLR